MSAVTYDYIMNATPPTPIEYVAGAADTDLYPSACNPTIFGPVWLPRIYGKDLTSFEIASSGKVAITLNDVHAFDMSRYLVSGSTYASAIQATSNNALRLMAGSNSNMQLMMDTTTNTVSLASDSGSIQLASLDSNATLTMSNDVALYAVSNVVLTASNSFVVGAATEAVISVAGSNAYLRLDNTCNSSLYALHDVSFSACNALVAQASNAVSIGSLMGDVGIYTRDSNLLVSMTTSNSSNLLTLYSSAVTRVDDGLDLYLDAGSNTAISAAEQLTLEGTAGVTATSASNFEVYSTSGSNSSNVPMLAVSPSNVAINDNFAMTGTDFSATTTTTVLQSSSNTVISSACNLTVSGSNTLTLSGQNGITATADSNTSFYLLGSSNSSNVPAVSFGTSNVLINSDLTVNGSISTASANLALASSNVLIDAFTDASISSSNTLSVYAASNLSLVSDGDASLSASSNLWISTNSSNVFVNLLYPDDALQMYARTNVTVSASNDISMIANSNALLQGSNVAIISEGTSSIYGSNAVGLSVFNSNAYVVVDGTTESVISYALQTYSVLASNSVSIVSAATTSMSAPTFSNAATNASIAASNTLVLSSASTANITAPQLSIQTSNLGMTAASNIDFFITSSSNPEAPVFRVDQNKVRIYGDIEVTGRIDTTSINNLVVNEVTLNVQDKLIRVAKMDDAGSNIYPADGEANDRAGLEVDGAPSGSDSNLAPLYEKSFTWRHSVDGVSSIGTSNANRESFWELLGGGMRLTARRNLGSVEAPEFKETSFGIRINQMDELEFVKKYWDSNVANAYVYKRVARFGRVTA
jgi:hypothetical protein